MLSNRGYIVLFLIGIGLLGAFLRVMAQDRPPWPARPIVPPDDVVVPQQYVPPSHQNQSPSRMPPVEARPLQQASDVVKIVDVEDPKPLPGASPPPVDFNPLPDANPPLPNQGQKAVASEVVSPPQPHVPQIIDINDSPAPGPGPANGPENSSEKLNLVGGPPETRENLSPPVAPTATPITPAAPPPPVFPSVNSQPISPSVPVQTPVDPAPTLVKPPVEDSLPKVENKNPAPPTIPDPKYTPAPRVVAAPPAPDLGVPKPDLSNPKPENRNPVIAFPEKSFTPEPETPVTPSYTPPAEPARPPTLRVLLPNRCLPSAAPDLEYHSTQCYTRPPQVSASAPVVSGTPVAPGADPTALFVEKRGPSSIRLGQTIQYEILVRNRGNSPAYRVRVEDEILSGGRFIGGSPAPQLNGDRASWIVETVQPGQETRLLVDVQSTTPGEIVSNATVSLSSNSVRTMVADTPVQARVNLIMKVPPHAALGQAMDVECRIINIGNQKLSGLVLHVVLPKDKIAVNLPGNNNFWGEAVDADVVDLAPGANQTIKLPARAAQPGRHLIRAEVLTSTQQSVASTQSTVEVTKAGISLRRAGASRIILDREAEMQLEVTNHQDVTARNVVVTETLPEGLEFIAASDYGLYRPESRTVNWIVDNLGPTESRMLTVQVQGLRAGERQFEIVARGQGEDDIVQASGTIAVGGIPALVLKVQNRDAALEVGKETVYEVRVHNDGNAADTDVQVRAFLPEGMTPRTMHGPTAYKIEGQQVIFAPLARLNAQGDAVYQLTVVARTPGDCRLRVQVTSAQVSSPLTREERTLVYQD